ncbi:hypothetical protein JCGZ_00335 [Jatropha curcas]|uniref:Uncharacterized protein n=1 Tax=Jatropha curcas TaxID=180498 RepID=A0A067JGY7_JATCU|nr:hypothetical protein JCGZ_00335 [Jatropha curcas]
MATYINKVVKMAHFVHPSLSKNAKPVQGHPVSPRHGNSTNVREIHKQPRLLTVSEVAHAIRHGAHAPMSSSSTVRTLSLWFWDSLI